MTTNSEKISFIFFSYGTLGGEINDSCNVTSLDNDTEEAKKKAYKLLIESMAIDNPTYKDMFQKVTVISEPAIIENYGVFENVISASLEMYKGIVHIKTVKNLVDQNLLPKSTKIINLGRIITITGGKETIALLIKWIDFYEGVDEFYVRDKIPVMTTAGKVTVWTYLPTEKQVDMWIERLKDQKNSDV